MKRSFNYKLIYSGNRAHHESHISNKIRLKGEFKRWVILKIYYQADQ